MNSVAGREDRRAPLNFDAYNGVDEHNGFYFPDNARSFELWQGHNDNRLQSYDRLSSCGGFNDRRIFNRPAQPFDQAIMPRSPSGRVSFYENSASSWHPADPSTGAAPSSWSHPGPVVAGNVREDLYPVEHRTFPPAAPGMAESYHRRHLSSYHEARPEPLQQRHPSYSPTIPQYGPSRGLLRGRPLEQRSFYSDDSVRRKMFNSVPMGQVHFNPRHDLFVYNEQDPLFREDGFA